MPTTDAQQAAYDAWMDALEKEGRLQRAFWECESDDPQRAAISAQRALATAARQAATLVWRAARAR